MGLGRRQLGADEEIVVEVRSHRGSLVMPLIATLIALAAGVWLLTGVHQGPLAVRRAGAIVIGAVPLVWLAARYVTWRSRTVALTTQRVVVTLGVARRSSEQIRLERIIDVHLAQSLSDRVLRRGTLMIEVVDGSPWAVDRLRRPEALQRLILRQMSIAPEASGSPPIPELIDWPTYTVVTELDPTPVRGTPAISGSHAATLAARLDELDRLEADGVLSSYEASRRRAQLTGHF